MTPVLVPNRVPSFMKIGCDILNFLKQHLRKGLELGANQG
jgi:hypothetical protein